LSRDSAEAQPGGRAPILSCRSLHHVNPNGTLNLSWYCSPHADQLARQAQALQPTDPVGPGHRN